ncbi:CRP-like cAMP-binding protein [Aquimarina sp. MAR_2010_214]|uniref:Crp/Fnr family transcriptional regulator n=1 Tax=Aquimarina sp. MAR_2010_214 TaxID=1250026 RepID=UPI000C709023|nr:Crp/Fnr family transcriptional regulator [Aquimarina sp. MAR_2010_214]PKV50392.1 CRP-like cAMP-binding protein [Aquimarina sp. MAR_2010_214]
MEKIISSIKSMYAVSDASIASLTSKMTELHLPKKHILIKSGVVDKNYYFIEKGLTRSYCIIDGEEATTWFSKEGELAFSMLSCYENKPGFEYVDLLEDSIIYAIPVHKLNLLYETNIEIANWSRIAHQKAFLDLELRHIALATQSAKERYDTFTQEKSDLFKRVKLGYIASFLGVTQVTLSRLRAKQHFLT